MAAKTGVTTIIDYAGPVMDITSNLALYGCGMNVGCIDAVLPDKLGRDPSRTQIKAFLDESLANGSLGLKILGGHYPLTPESSRICVEEANKRQVLVACHAGSTKNRSDIFGLEEAVEFAKGQRLFMAHINAYCRGNRYSYSGRAEGCFQTSSGKSQHYFRLSYVCRQWDERTLQGRRPLRRHHGELSEDVRI